MVPGITDTECRIKQLRYRELHVEAERQRLAATACAQAGSGCRHHCAARGGAENGSGIRKPSRASGGS